MYFMCQQTNTRTEHKTRCDECAFLHTTLYTTDYTTLTKRTQTQNVPFGWLFIWWLRPLPHPHECICSARPAFMLCSRRPSDDRLSIPPLLSKRPCVATVLHIEHWQFGAMQSKRPGGCRLYSVLFAARSAKARD